MIYQKCDGCAHTFGCCCFCVCNRLWYGIAKVPPILGLLETHTHTPKYARIYSSVCVWCVCYVELVCVSVLCVCIYIRNVCRHLNIQLIFFFILYFLLDSEYWALLLYFSCIQEVRVLRGAFVCVYYVLVFVLERSKDERFLRHRGHLDHLTAVHAYIQSHALDASLAILSKRDTPHGMCVCFLLLLCSRQYSQVGYFQKRS